MKVWILTENVDLGVRIDSVYDNPDTPRRLAVEYRERDRTTWTGSDGNTHSMDGGWNVEEHAVQGTTCVPVVPTGESWCMCNDCGTWKQMQDGNHHPWCHCGSDNFRWEDEREPESRRCTARLNRC